MATKTKSKAKSQAKSQTKSYEVDYKAAIAEIKKLEQKLTTIKGKVSPRSRVQISLQLGILKTVQSFCLEAGPRMKMSKCLEAPARKMSKSYV